MNLPVVSYIRGAIGAILAVIVDRYWLSSLSVMLQILIIAGFALVIGFLFDLLEAGVRVMITRSKRPKG